MPTGYPYDAGHFPARDGDGEIVEADISMEDGAEPLRATSAETSSRQAEVSPSFDRLSPREREVLALIADGYATKEIAVKLKVSIKTAETHRRNLMDKLQINNVAGLTKYAVRNGLSSS